jgi:uncharacterized protein YkwD
MLAIGVLVGSYLGVPAAADNSHEACIRYKTNQERTSRGIPALRDDPRIDTVARRHSQRLARDETVYHNPNLASEIPPYEYAGENVGMSDTCQSVHDAFLGSPGHKENMLDRDYQYVGVGVTERDDTVYVVVDFFTPTTRVSTRPPPTRGCR